MKYNLCKRLQKACNRLFYFQLLLENKSGDTGPKPFWRNVLIEGQLVIHKKYSPLPKLLYFSY
ncbi:MAG: hypothetical protein ABI172_06415 [Ginsengibacter sp.]